MAILRLPLQQKPLCTTPGMLSGNRLQYIIPPVRWMWSIFLLMSKHVSWSLVAGLMMASRWFRNTFIQDRSINSTGIKDKEIALKVDLRHEHEIRAPRSVSYRDVENSPRVDVGIDLTEFYMSVEWDILEVPAKRNVKFYTCCDEPYLDITFNITMRRKTLFYTVNLIIPCMGISFLTILVFYLPSDSGEKVSFASNNLYIIWYFILTKPQLVESTYYISSVFKIGIKYLKTIISGESFYQHPSLPHCVLPASRRDHPAHLAGGSSSRKVCTFYNDSWYIQVFIYITFCLEAYHDDYYSICVTVVVLNVHFRTPQTHTMTPWVRRVFIHILPRLLNMKRPLYEKDRHRYITIFSDFFFSASESPLLHKKSDLLKIAFSWSTCMPYVSMPSSTFHIHNFLQLEGVRPSRVLITPSQVRITIITTRKMRWRALISLMNMQTLSLQKGKYSVCVLILPFFPHFVQNFYCNSFKILFKLFCFCNSFISIFQGPWSN